MVLHKCFVGTVCLSGFICNARAGPRAWQIGNHRSEIKNYEKRLDFVAGTLYIMRAFKLTRKGQPLKFKDFFEKARFGFKKANAFFLIPASKANLFLLIKQLIKIISDL